MELMLDYNFNLEMTQLSGQTSQPPWGCEKDIFKEVVSVDGKPVLFKVSDDSFSYEMPLNADFNVNEKTIFKKFHEIYDLDFNLEKFYSYLDADENLKNAKDFCSGLRLFIAKDPFECVISSICSANNSIKRWTKSVSDIKEKIGTGYEFPSGTYYTFPSSETLMNTPEDVLKSCGVGYRAPYMIGAGELFTLEMDLSDFSKMDYDEAFKTILEVPGVGPKVADCILLYGFRFNEAFPSDVWIKRIVSHLYFDGTDISVPKVRSFGMEKFGSYAGYVQLYLFHYARRSGLMEKLKNR